MNVTRRVEQWLIDNKKPFMSRDIERALGLAPTVARNAISRLRQLNLVTAVDHLKSNNGCIIPIYEYDPLGEDIPQDLTQAEEAWARLMGGLRYDSYTFRR
jgi:hypothetical protein